MGLAAARKRGARDHIAIDPAEHVGAPPQDPAVLLERTELRRSVAEAIMELPDREREVVVLRLLHHRSTRETADMLECAEGTVKAALHHATRKLQSSMEVWVDRPLPPSAMGKYQLSFQYALVERRLVVQGRLARMSRKLLVRVL